jgi:predicted RNA-binding Zn-ribbon protein involved in translation (DUF1610 family)
MSKQEEEKQQESSRRVVLSFSMSPDKEKQFREFLEQKKLGVSAFLNEIIDKIQKGGIILEEKTLENLTKNLENLTSKITELLEVFTKKEEPKQEKQQKEEKPQGISPHQYLHDFLGFSYCPDCGEELDYELAEKRKKSKEIVECEGCGVRLPLDLADKLDVCPFCGSEEARKVRRK